MTGMARVASSRSFTAMVLKMFIGWLLLAGEYLYPGDPRSCTDFAAPGRQSFAAAPVPCEAGI
jgi:hypothetical protein